MPPFDGSPYDYFEPLIVIHGGIWTACVCAYFIRRVWSLLGSV